MSRGLGIGQLLFELRNSSILKLASLGEVAVALRLLQLDPRRIEVP